MSGSISVLIVDDNPPVVITLADVLELKGFTVHAVFSGAAALEILRHHPVDIPVMPDATNVSRGSGIMEYETASSVSQVVDLYFQYLGSLGWTLNQEKPTGELKIPLGLTFVNGDQELSIDVDNAEAGGLDVTLMIYNPNEQAAASTSATPPPAGATSTPSGPLPTIDASKSGLPTDISLYPGATNLQKIPGTQGIAFDVPDLPDQVDAFYRQEMVAAGWNLINETKSEATIVQMWQKASRMASINISTANAKTNVMILIITQ
jgi:CheY-like chemotaxis protein